MSEVPESTLWFREAIDACGVDSEAFILLKRFPNETLKVLGKGEIE